MHSIKVCFDKILAALRQSLGAQFPCGGNLLRPGPKPKFTDMEVIALSLAAESLGIDSELYLFSLIEASYKEKFPNIISRRQYNDRRKLLFKWISHIRQSMSDPINEINEVYAVDSMPLEICKMARMSRSNMGKESEETTPDKGYCAAQDRYYYGYKLHMVCSPSGVVSLFDLTKASVHDSNFLHDVGSTHRDCLVTGDRGYIVNLQDSKAIRLRESNVELSVPYRSNQKIKKPQLYVLKKIRKRIETVFSQLCDQFRIQRNYAKSFSGYRTRILAKITSMTALQYINKYVTNRPLGKLKYALI